MRSFILFGLAALLLGGCSDDEASDSTKTCQTHEELVRGICTPCGLGFTKDPETDSEEGSACVAVYCDRNTRVESNTCVPCPDGTRNEEGDWAPGADTQCESSLCGNDEFVRDHACVYCENGDTNLPFDDANGADTVCDGYLCRLNQFVLSHRCLPCLDGATNEAGDNALGADTACDPVPCAGNEFVSGSTCRACLPGTVNAAGDDPAGADTICEVADACGLVLGVQCSDFEQAYIKASNTESNDHFAQSIAFDGNTLAVGAGAEASSATGVNADQTSNDAERSGAVYVFTRTGTSWRQEAYLKASNTGRGDLFGGTLALSGDTLVVGATDEASDSNGVNGAQDNENAKGSGAAYVFKRSNGKWSQQAYLKASNTSIDDHFGASVDIDGDTIVVGASHERSNAFGVNGDQHDESMINSGAAYVFVRTDQTWVQQAYLKASNTDKSDRFGAVIVIQGDTVVVGAPYEDSSAAGIRGLAPFSGAVYVFVRSGTTWVQQAYLKADNTKKNIGFGTALAIDGDTLVAGAGGETSDLNGNEPADFSTFQSGAAYVFLRVNGIWSQQAFLKASNPGQFVFFGDSLALQGDLLAVGAWGESSNSIGLNGDEFDTSLRNSGAVYLFERIEDNWRQKAYLKASNTGRADTFGSSLGLDDGTLVVGAGFESSNATGVNGDQANNDASLSGAVYVRVIAP